MIVGYAPNLFATIFSSFFHIDSDRSVGVPYRNIMKDTLHRRLVSMNRSRANMILKNLFSECDELCDLRNLRDELKIGLSTLKRALALLSLNLD